MRTAPPHSMPVRPPTTRTGERDSEPEREYEPEQNPERERAIDGADQRIGEQVLGVALLARTIDTAEHPPDVRVKQPA